MNNQEIKTLGEKYCLNVFSRLPIAMTKGEGAYVYDADGNKYLDFVAGIAVNSLGHAHPKIAAAIAKQAETLIHCSNLYWIEPQVQMAKLLVENSAFDKVFFGNSGAEANEGAIKLARKYSLLKGYTDRNEVITMVNSFHGRTLATMTASGQDKMHKGFGGLPEGFKYATYNDLTDLQSQITDKTCAIMLEPIQGEGGVYPAEQEFLETVRKICDEKEICLIYDEVQVGMGRTGKMFAYEHSGVVPDIITLAKAIGSGVPMGAFMTTDKVAAAMKPGDHGSTFGGNPLVCAAAVATMEVMLEEKIPDNAQEMGEFMKQEFEYLKAKYPYVLEIRGEGLILGLQLAIPGAKIVEKCLENGLLINCTASTVLRFVPPLNITKNEVRECIEILDKVMEQA